MPKHRGGSHDPPRPAWIGADLSARIGIHRTRLNGTRLMARPNEDGLDDAEIRGLDAEEQRRVLLTWFRAHYVAPEDHRLLINHQDWLSDEDEEAPEAFANSDEEPVDALDVITRRFARVINDELLNEIAGELEKTATH